MSAPRTDVEEVARVNTAFYEAMERGDFEELSTLWLAPMDIDGAEHTADPEDLEDAETTEATDRGAEVSCVHPGWPVLTGRGEVLRSYALIMANTEYIQFFLTDVHVSVISDTALVTCTENILSGGPAPEDSDELGPLVGQLVVATNVFRRTSEGWKLWSHHASPVLAESGEEESDDSPS
ncbi:nuclear transport factor 2 family protein [Streptomyces sp. NBC_00286]|uniref:nuclear transport factor 2 family protein n=1 Tax=Streptomyces sp. NBC_00286 TaxID=2975701 RepID=UPI002E2CF908|nr:nuclear transport factor 2 family protein [Streptomyces sp. NBC_00286]